MTRPGDTAPLRKARGAFFTPEAIAEYLVRHAVKTPEDRVLDPTCGEAVFLLHAGRRLRELGASPADSGGQLFGVDVHAESLNAAAEILASDELAASLVAEDFFNVATPSQLGAALPMMDAVIGNPPFIRYQEHVGQARTRSARAALEQGVRLSGLASSWAAMLVHACSFLKPDGRLAMVLPAELLSVGYAEPVRAWLRRRFAQVHLVLFEHLQFDDASEKVVLLLAKGSGGCDAFSLYYVPDASDLAGIQLFDNFSVVPAATGKWTDLLMPVQERQLFRSTVASHFDTLGSYGSVELGSVTGANSYFCLTDATRLEYGLEPGKHLLPICPPGSRHLKGTSFTMAAWTALRDRGERVWLLRPAEDCRSAGLRRYIAYGEKLGVPDAYKCTIRSPWWRSPAVPSPDFFFTYMSHRYPRLVSNTAGVTFLNSMHGLRLVRHKRIAKTALPLLALNSVTMLGAELYGRAYGGGVLKMEPREAAGLPVPSAAMLVDAWTILSGDQKRLDRLLQAGDWTNVVKRVDEVLLRDVLRMPADDREMLYVSAQRFRQRRLGVTGDEHGSGA